MLPANVIRSRFNYKPYQTFERRWGFEKAEVMSYPFGDDEVVLMFVRQYQMPTTARYVALKAEDRTDLAHAESLARN